jgi:hypothetical protein
MSDEQDSWMSGLGVDVQSLRDAASSVGSAVGDAASSVAQAASDSGGGSPNIQETTASGAAPYVGAAASGGGGGRSDDSSGGFLSGIANVVSDVASGAVNTVENVASDVGHAVSDAATGVINTAETAASDIEKTAVDAGSGLWNTAKTVGGDIASGNFGDALGDAEKGVVSTTGGVVSDVAHTVVDTASAGLDATAKVLVDAQQGVADVAKGAISTAGNVVGDVANTVSNVAGRDSAIGRAASAVGGFAHSAADDAVSAVNTAADFDKGLVEGVAGGVEGMAKGLVNLGDSAGREAFALATDANARAQAFNTVVQDAKAVGQFEQTLITDPSKALNQVGSAIESGATTVGNMAEGVYKQYQQAAAAGHGAEFIGKGVGQAAVVVAGAVLTDGAGLAGEGAAVAGEGAALVGEGAAIAGEGAALGGEVAGGVTTAEELGTAATQLAGRGATTAEELGTAATQVAGQGATTAEELGTATTQLADRGASAAEELADGPTAIPGADPGPLPARFQGPSQPIKLFDTELQPIEPGSPNLTATPKPSEPIPYELGDGPPSGQVQLRPGDGSSLADPLAQTQEMPAFSEADTVGADGEEVAETPTDPAAPKDRVQRSPNDPRMTRPLGNIASHDEQGLALRDATGERTSESEHIWSRANIAEQTRNPATGVSPFDNTTDAGMANYDDATTLKLGRETAVEKTAGDNAAWRALKKSGGAPTPQMLEDSGLEAAMNRTLDAAQKTGDTSVTTQGVNLAAHGELGKVFEAGTSDVRAFMQGVSDEEIDAALDFDKATVDPRFAAPKGMGIPLRADPVAAQAAADAVASETADAAAAASNASPPQPRVRIDASVLENAEREAQAEAEADAQAEIESTRGLPPQRGR